MTPNDKPFIEDPIEKMRDSNEYIEKFISIALKDPITHQLIKHTYSVFYKGIDDKDRLNITKEEWREWYGNHTNKFREDLLNVFKKKGILFDRQDPKEYNRQERYTIQAIEKLLPIASFEIKKDLISFLMPFSEVSKLMDKLLAVKKHYDQWPLLTNP